MPTRNGNGAKGGQIRCVPPPSLKNPCGMKLRTKNTEFNKRNKAGRKAQGLDAN